MNEWLFLGLSLLSLSGVVTALRFGKEALIGWLALLLLLMNLLVVKQIRLFGLEATCVDGLGLGIALGLNLLREYWGAAESKRALLLCFWLAMGASLIGRGVVAFEPSQEDVASASVEMLFSPSLRITAASIASFFLCEWLEIGWFGWLKERWSGRSLAWRHLLSAAPFQLLDTLLFTWWGLWGVVQPAYEWGPLLQIGLVSLGTKGLALLLSSPFAHYSKRLIPPMAHVAV